MLVSMQLIKAHLRIDLEPDSEVDTLLEHYYHSAVEYCENFIGRKIPWESDMEVPRSIIQSILLLIGEYYENREAMNVAPYHRNPNIDQMLHFYRIGLGV